MVMVWWDIRLTSIIVIVQPHLRQLHPLHRFYHFQCNSNGSDNNGSDGGFDPRQPDAAPLA